MLGALAELKVKFLTIMLFLLDWYPFMLGLAGTGGTPFVPLLLFVFKAGSVVLDAEAGWLEGGVELVAYAEFNVEDDFCEGTLLLEFFEESDVRKLARDRRRRSLKKVIMIIFVQ